MKVVVVYESMYGNTHLVADAVAQGFGQTADVTVVPVGEATRDMVDAADLLVVGGPTHAHTLSRASTRKAAAEAAEKPDSGLTVEPGAAGTGVRDWLASLGPIDTRSAAFDTRIKWPAFLAGRASKRIARELRRHGSTLIAGPESFLVTKENQLLPDQEARAHDWGARLASTMSTART